MKKCHFSPRQYASIENDPFMSQFWVYLSIFPTRMSKFWKWEMLMCHYLVQIENLFSQFTVSVCLEIFHLKNHFKSEIYSNGTIRGKSTQHNFCTVFLDSFSGNRTSAQELRHKLRKISLTSEQISFGTSH